MHITYRDHCEVFELDRGDILSAALLVVAKVLSALLTDRQFVRYATGPLARASLYRVRPCEAGHAD